MGHKAQILVVDDNLQLGEVLCEFLATQGLDVKYTSDALSAMRVACVNDVRVLVTDLSLPDMNGTELARTLREPRPHLGVIIISGDSRPVSLDSGFAFLQKPFSLTDLARQVVRLAGC